ncbi:MAG TPA: DUF5655 domain-containing protein [Thermoanaerobaculia bacterium]|nr:DUF5655 domain-containing protein [Thermoanaerobaculia bacterium]
MSKSPAEMIASISSNIPKRTGRTMDEWVRLVQLQGPPVFKDRIEWLKTEHAMKSVTAKVIADKASGGSWSRLYENSDALIETLYAGARAPLRNMYDQLVTVITRLGDDVKVSPRKTYSSLIRNRQFGVIKPARKRLDVGLALNEEESRKARIHASSGLERPDHASCESSLDHGYR